MIQNEVEYSIVIPSYRGADSLPELVERLTRAMAIIGKSFEVVLVNDDSPDHTWEVVMALKPQYPQLRAFRLMSNVGQYRALMCGFEQVRGRYVVTMDDDLQNPPEEIRKLISALQDHPEMDGVIGAYRQTRRHLWRRVGSGVVQMADRLVSRQSAGLQTTSFRLLRRQLVDTLVMHKTMIPTIDPLMVQNTKRLMNVPVEHHPRSVGVSNYDLPRLLKLSFDHVLNYSTLPLKVVSAMGLLSSLLSIVLGFTYLFLFLFSSVGAQVKGWTTLVLLSTFFSGLILFSLGLIGEYLIRIIREVSRAPRYVIRDVI